MRIKVALLIVFVVSVITSSGIISAITYSDEDGDGILEVGEVITFIGDDSYVDDQGKEYPYNNWSWDFNSDSVIDKYGKEVNWTFNEKGTYVITVYELGEINIKTELKIKIVIPMPEDNNLTYLQKLQRAINNTDVLIKHAEADENGTDDKFNLKFARFFLKLAHDKEGTWKWLPFIAVKLAVKSLEKVLERGIRNTTAIMLNLSHAVKDKVEGMIKDAEEKLGANNCKVVLAWKRFNKGVIKLDEGRYSKAIEEFYKANWAL